jgi:hypothetical protein
LHFAVIHLQESHHRLVLTSYSQEIPSLPWAIRFLLPREMYSFLLNLHPLHLCHFHTIFATVHSVTGNSMLVQKTPHHLVRITMMRLGVMSTWMVAVPDMDLVCIPMWLLGPNNWKSIRWVESKNMRLYQVKYHNSLFPNLISLFNPFDILKYQWNP